MDKGIVIMKIIISGLSALSAALFFAMVGALIASDSLLSSAARIVSHGV
jgi:hypothetical protein